MAREDLETFMRDRKVTVSAIFIPWSKSRNYAANTPVTKRTLNWRITVERDGRAIYTTDYSAGIGHAPSYTHGRITLDVENALKWETENGLQASTFMHKRKPILPDACDVLSSLALDASVLNEGSFEDWASSLGYDSDSRSAEAIYRACLDCALKLRAGLGDDGLRALQDAAQDY